MTSEQTDTRRRYSAAMKAQVVAACGEPGASVAKVAMAHGINANVVHRWRQEARDSASSVGVREFVPVSVPAPTHTTHQDCADIRIELRRGATTMAITWPSAAANECAAWMRELLR